MKEKLHTQQRSLQDFCETSLTGISPTRPSKVGPWTVKSNISRTSLVVCAIGTGYICLVQVPSMRAFHKPFLLDELVSTFSTSYP